MSEVLTSKSYPSKLLKGFQSLFLEGMLCDLTLVVDSQQMDVHRSVMAASSDYFKVLLTIDMKEKGQKSINLKGVSWKGLQELVTFAYTGQLHCRFDNINDILLTATHLQFTDAVELCCNYLENHTSIGTCVDMYKLADKYSLTTLKNKALLLILKFFEDISQRDDFVEFSHDFLLAILPDDRLSISSELQLFQIVCKWLRSDETYRMQKAGDLMKNVRLQLIKPNDIVDSVMNVPFMTTNPDCLQLVLEANKYHMLTQKQPLLQNERSRVRSTDASIVILDLDDDGPHVFDLASQRWASLCFANVETFHAQVCVIDNFMYICGGIELYSTNNPVSAKCYRYDPRFDAWAEISSMQEPRHHFTLVGDKSVSMFAIGGYCGGLHKNVVEQYLIEEDRWSRRKPLDTRLSAAASAVLSGRIYVVGGQTDKGISHNLWCLDSSKDTWESKSPMLTARMDHTVCAYARRLFVLGGYNKDIIKAYDVSSVDCYEVETDQWSVVCENTPKISGINSCLIDFRVYMVGGFSYDENKKRSEVWCYDIKSNRWETVGRIHNPAMAVPCCALCMPRYILKGLSSS